MTTVLGRPRQPGLAERNKRIAEMYLAGTPVDQIAAQFRLHCDYIRQIAMLRGARRRPLNEERNRGIIQMYIAGTPLAEIAERFKVDQSSVSIVGRGYRAQRAEAKAMRVREIAQAYTADAPVGYAERRQRILAMREAGLTLQQVADCFGVTRERVRQIEAKAQRGREGALAGAQ